MKLTEREIKLMEENEFTEDDIRAVRRAKAARKLDREDERAELEAIAQSEAEEEAKEEKKKKGDFEIV